MRTAFKRLALEHVPHSLLLAAYFPLYFGRQLPDFTAALLEENIAFVSELDLGSVATSDTVFILGSGSSIGAIDEERWAAIERHDSIGFNLWVAHRHVPTLYTFEALDLRVDDGLRKQTTAHYEREMLHRQAEYRSVPKIITDLSWDRLDFFGSVPPGFRENLYAMQTVPVFARTAEEFESALELLNRLGAFEERDRIFTTFKFRATLSLIFSLALNIGYRRIVTCGVDLNDSRYFFHDEELYPEMYDYAVFPKERTHITQVKEAAMPTIAEILMEMKRQLLEPRGVELFVENPSSLLHQELGIPVWEER